MRLSSKDQDAIANILTEGLFYGGVGDNNRKDRRNPIKSEINTSNGETEEWDNQKTVEYLENFFSAYTQTSPSFENFESLAEVIKTEVIPKLSR